MQNASNGRDGVPLLHKLPQHPTVWKKDLLGWISLHLGVNGGQRRLSERLGRLSCSLTDCLFDCLTCSCSMHWILATFFFFFVSELRSWDCKSKQSNSLPPVRMVHSSKYDLLIKLLLIGDSGMLLSLCLFVCVCCRDREGKTRAAQSVEPSLTSFSLAFLWKKKKNG